MSGSENFMKQGLDDREIIERGRLAAEAYNNPILAIVLKEISDGAMNAIDKAPPDHTKEVMWYKQMRQVIGIFAGELASKKQHAEKVLEKMRQEHDPQQQEQRRLDEQGFGLNFGSGAGQ